MRSQRKMPPFSSNFQGDKIFLKLKVSADFRANREGGGGSGGWEVRGGGGGGVQKIAEKFRCLRRDAFLGDPLTKSWFICGDFF